MDEFNIILSLWRLSLLVSVITLAIGIFKKSWMFLLISTITFVPIAYYFSGAVNALRYVGLVPFFLLIMTILFWLFNRKK
ncbi:hypothetical protein ACXYMX_09365 [Sporosarcina sp. CAU 1771]